MSSELIPLKKLAAELQMDRSHLRKYVRQIGIEPGRIRTPASRNQPTLAVTQEEAERIRQERRRSGFSSSGEIESPEFGKFYVVVPDPEARRNRVKFGYSSNALEGRMDSYRTINPCAELLESWKCKRTWEAAAIAACANLEGTMHIQGEVYDVCSIEDTLKQCRKFFKLVLPEETG